MAHIIGNVNKGADHDNRCSSPSVRVAMSLAVAIIVGLGAALAVYLQSNKEVAWTVIAGGGAALVSGLIMYGIFRNAFGGQSPANAVKTIQVGSAEEPILSHCYEANK